MTTKHTVDACSYCGIPIDEHPLTDACAIATENQDERLRLAAPDLADALVAVLTEVDALAQGETCDHSVNICWCATHLARESARAALKKAGRP